jgi:ferric enterobactin receptor
MFQRFRRGFVGLLCAFPLLIFAQNTPKSTNEVKITHYFDYNTLDEVFQTLQKEYNLTIDYTPESVKNTRFSYSFSDTELNRAMEIALRNTSLAYLIDDNGIIHIFDKRKREAEISAVANSHFKGKAEKRGFTLSGVVKDKKSGETLPFVNIVVVGTGTGAASNVDGYYTIPQIPSDTSSLSVSYIGYKSRKIFLSPKTPSANFMIELEPTDVTLDEVTVKAEHEEILRANQQISMFKMTPAKINILPNIGEKDMFRAFQLMPGISASNEASSGLYVRGGTPDQTLVLYDGFTVYHVEHLFGFFSAFNSNAIKDIQLYKGGFDAKFGGRLSSVAEITSRDGNAKQLNVGADASLLSVNGFVEAPIGKNITVWAAGRRSYPGYLYNLIFKKFSGQNTTTAANAPEQGGLGRRGNFANLATTVASYFYDLNSKITFRPTDKDILSLSLYNGTDNMDNSRKLSLPAALRNRGINVNFDINDATNWGNTGASLKWSRRWSDRFYSNALVSYSNYFSKRDRSSGGTSTNAAGVRRDFRTGTLEKNDLNDVSAKIDAEYKLNNHNLIEFGTNLLKNDIAYTYSQNDTISVIDRRVKATQFTGYIQDKIQLFGDILTFIPGIRATNYSLTNKMYYEPRASLTLQPTPQIKLKAAVGQYYQFIKRVVREDIFQGSRDFWTLADDGRLPVGGAVHYIGGASWENTGWLVDVEAYQKNLTGLSEYTLRITPNPRSVSFSENFFTGTGIAKGLDVLVQRKYGKWNGWVAYTLGQVKYNFPAFGGDFYANQDVRHEFKLINSYRWRNWDLAATWIYATGRPYTAPEGGYQIKLLDGTTRDYVSVSSKNGYRLPAYHRADISATYNWKNSVGAPSSIGFSVFNAYNRTNVWYKEFLIQDGQLIENNINFLGITPNVTLSWKLR